MVEFSSGLKGMALNLETELQSYAHTSQPTHDHAICVRAVLHGPTVFKMVFDGV